MDLEELKNKESNLRAIYHEARNRIKSAGFWDIEIPKNTFEMPKDVTALNDRQLGKLHQVCVQWEIYAGEKLAQARVIAMAMSYNYELQVVKKSIRLEGNVTTVKQKALASQIVRKAKMKWLEAEAASKLFEAQAQRFIRQAQFVSREQSRRTNTPIG